MGFKTFLENLHPGPQIKSFGINLHLFLYQEYKEGNQPLRKISKIYGFQFFNAPQMLTPLKRKILSPPGEISVNVPDSLDQIHFGGRSVTGKVETTHLNKILRKLKLKNRILLLQSSQGKPNNHETYQIRNFPDHELPKKSL